MWLFGLIYFICALIVFFFIEKYFPSELDRHPSEVVAGHFFASAILPIGIIYYSYKIIYIIANNSRQKQLKRAHHNDINDTINDLKENLSGTLVGSKIESSEIILYLSKNDDTHSYKIPNFIKEYKVRKEVLFTE